MIARAPATATAILACALAAGVCAVAVGACHRAPAPRACRTNAACASGEYCVFTPALCGQGKRAGTCLPRARGGCPAAFAPVCACDRRVYDSECQARAAGVDLAVAGGCTEPRPRDWIACGARFCDARSSYCEIVLSDVFELPTDFTCKPLPPACVPTGGVARACDCFPKATRCLSFCGYIDTGGLAGFHLTCRL